MTPQERALVAELFNRLASLENAPRDADAEKLIRDGLRQAPNALYALVQTVLVQDEALKRANARIEELEGGMEPQEQQPGGFLDSMRDSLFGRRTSVPEVPANRSWNNAPAYPPQPYAPPGAAPSPGTGGSFLGTAAAAAAGVIGGSLLLGGIRSMMGQPATAFDPHQPQGLDNPAASPWGTNPAAPGGDLARDAGLNDIGRTPGNDTRTGLFDTANEDTGGDHSDEADYAADFDLGGDSDVG